MLKLKSSGRGSQFSVARGLAEMLQTVVYARGWPSRILNQVPAATRVQLIEHELTLSAGTGATPPTLAFARFNGCGFSAADR